MPYPAFRIVKTVMPRADDFKSRKQLGHPRPWSLPEADPDPWDGCSVYETLEQAERFARRRPRLGSYVAELLIPDGAPVVRGPASSTGHFELWADPAVLAGYVVRVTSV